MWIWNILRTEGYKATINCAGILEEEAATLVSLAASRKLSSTKKPAQSRFSPGANFLMQDGHPDLWVAAAFCVEYVAVS
jgi:prepilin-type processing-associated H-X9-DG protein